MLSNPNIRLRALEPNDIDILYTIENDTDIWHVSDTLIPYSKVTLENYILNSHQDIYTTKQLRMVVCSQANNTVMGLVDLYDFEPHTMKAGVGIVTLQQYQNQKIGSQALTIFIDYAFDHLNMHQLYASIPENNLNSIQLFEKQNFEVSGVKKDWSIHNGEYINHLFLQRFN